jgi:hypothetical protein
VPLSTSRHCPKSPVMIRSGQIGSSMLGCRTTAFLSCLQVMAVKLTIVDALVRRLRSEPHEKLQKMGLRPKWSSSGKLKTLPALTTHQWDWLMGPGTRYLSRDTLRRYVRIAVHMYMTGETLWK